MLLGLRFIIWSMMNHYINFILHVFQLEISLIPQEIISWLFFHSLLPRKINWQSLLFSLIERRGKALIWSPKIFIFDFQTLSVSPYTEKVYHYAHCKGEMLEGVPSVIAEQVLKVNLRLRSSKLIISTYLPSFSVSPFWIIPYSGQIAGRFIFHSKALVISNQGSLKMREQAARV